MPIALIVSSRFSFSEINMLEMTSLVGIHSKYTKSKSHDFNVVVTFQRDKLLCNPSVDNLHLRKT